MGGIALPFDDVKDMEQEDVVTFYDKFWLNVCRKHLFNANIIYENTATDSNGIAINSNDMRSQTEKLFEDILSKQNLPVEELYNLVIRDILDIESLFSLAKFTEVVEIFGKHGIIKNIIDLMGDFGSQGITLHHPNKKVQKFYRSWWAKVQGSERSERFLNLLYRAGNVPVYKRYGRISKKEDRDKLTAEEKTTQQFLRIYDEKLKELNIAKDKANPGPGGGGGSGRSDEEVKILEDELKQMAEQLKIGGKTLAQLHAEYKKDGSIPQTSITRSQTPQAQSQTPQAQSQTPIMGEDTKGSGDTKGSVVEYLTGDRSHSKYRADHGGGNYHEHLAFNTTEERDSAISLLKSNGIVIGSMNDGRHAPGSYHYVDKAFDIPLYPNIQNLGISDDRKGEEKFSAMVRKILYKGGFKGKGMGEGISQSPVSITPKQTPDKAQKVSSTTSYEETGTQIALLEVPVPTPSGGGGGGSSRSSGSSGSGGDVNTYTGDLIVASHYREA